MDDHENTTNDRTTRRRFLELGGLAAGAVAGATVFERGSTAEAAGTGPAAVASGLVTCVLTPEQTEGLYFTAGDKVRRNVTEGKPGAPIALRLTVVDVSSCRPIKGAAVDIWHCDALGVYSDVAQQGTEGQTFLRGIQKTDAKGVARFQTIYPGWYQGRTVHIHTRVYLGGTIVHTGQLYFADAVTDAVYTRPPYSSRPNRDPRNAGDGIFRNGGSKSLLRLGKSGSGYVATLTMGVSRS